MRKLTPRLANCYIPQPYRPDMDDDSTQLQRKEQEQEILSHRKIYDSDNGNTIHNSSTPIYQRKTHELRQLRLESNVVPSTSSNSNSYISGSAMIELGRTKVICTVVGPVTSNCPVVPPSMTLSMDRGAVQVEVSYLAHHASLPSHHIPVNAAANNPNMMGVVAHSGSTTSTITSPSQQQPILNPKQCQKYIQDQEVDLSLRIQRAISSVIPLEQYPKCAIVLQFLILYNDDANIVATCLNVASLALASAQIEMYSVVTAGTVATVTMATTPQSLSLSSSNRNDDIKNKISGDGEEVVVLLADPTRDEMALADSIITIATLSNSDDNDNHDEEIALWEQQTLYNNYTNASFRGKSGGVTFTKNVAMGLCFDGCRTMYHFVRQHLLLLTNDGGDVVGRNDMAVVAPTLQNHKRPRPMIS